MPLVWAHAEYVKLLRSVTDGQVFDRISAVAERYTQGKRSTAIEVFRLNRQITHMVAGRKLRVLADDHFCLVWTMDNWQTTGSIDSRTVGYAGHFVDLETKPDQSGEIIFTFNWRGKDRWEGRNFEVRLEPAK
jgi:glucoamylase